MRKFFFILTLFVVGQSVYPQSVARQWNEEILNAIRNDFARPTVHARNLFHSSVAIYDIWALFDPDSKPYFLGNTVGEYSCNFDGFSTEEDIVKARHEAMSYAVYGLMKHRFADSPGKEDIFTSIDALMDSFGYDINFRNTNYKSGNPAALGNYLAEQLIAFGLQDGSNEAGDYENTFYEPLNDPLDTDITGNPDIMFPNNWQPLKVENYVDQSGNIIPGGQPPFLSPEWGKVTPFSLNSDQLTVYPKPGFDYLVYHDPRDPPYIQDGLGLDDPYKWGFAMVSVWASHLDKNDPTMMDISPRSLGNVSIDSYPTDFEDYDSFYTFVEGGDPSPGREINPSTGMPYESQLVPRGDYTRVLAEFWADGPDSETPPGHWFTILNYVNDQPQLVKKFRGKGDVLSDLEWDVKSYFILGGTMHDVAISAWGIKGYYDYIRPISAIRYMADQGQSTDPNDASYDPHGIPLVPNYIEVVKEGDPLAGAFNENVGKIKLFTWRGPDFIVDPNEDEAGVGWILAEEWFPYQRPSFVTPPFAGYVSGHSTFSRAAAEVLTLLTGDEYFPGGMGVFDIPKDEFLKFEKGPSVPFQLQWATYRDASDQTSLSRIWGGIHPPCDDIPGRIIGARIGTDAFSFAESYFVGALLERGRIYPNPTADILNVAFKTDQPLEVCIYDTLGRKVYTENAVFDNEDRCSLDISALRDGLYFVSLEWEDRRLFTERLVKK
ncbi:MAG: T9SS type A sorting domain-containing protein [Bacteroidia bacterium]|nr:T9SS type A sorting domain-containing protein [Bacteroidia bacterium]MBT8276476.1 T9SS type A sorting domain-containing protein [Bacteroidia bacterium]NNM09814.1 T9SS type A sorting domain-containing protein [Flavobacteriaceae bacterium]